MPCVQRETSRDGAYPCGTNIAVSLPIVCCISGSVSYHKKRCCDDPQSAYVSAESSKSENMGPLLNNGTEGNMEQSNKILCKATYMGKNEKDTHARSPR